MWGGSRCIYHTYVHVYTSSIFRTIISFSHVTNNNIYFSSAVKIMAQLIDKMGVGTSTLTKYVVLVVGLVGSYVRCV